MQVPSDLVQNPGGHVNACSVIADDKLPFFMALMCSFFLIDRGLPVSPMYLAPHLHFIWYMLPDFSKVSRGSLELQIICRIVMTGFSAVLKLRCEKTFLIARRAKARMVLFFPAS